MVEAVFAGVNIAANEKVLLLCQPQGSSAEQQINQKMNKDIQPIAERQAGIEAIPVLAAVWSQVSAVKWIRSDNAVVKYREDDNYMYAKPWLSGHKGWVAYSPTEEFPLSYKTKRGFNVNVKFKTAKNAMAKIDKLFPVK